jgi:Fic family protein
MSIDLKLKLIDSQKEAINRNFPSEESAAKSLEKYFRVDLTYSSNALEGSSLTLTETKVLLEDGLTAGGKPLREAYEASGHAEAYDYIMEIAHNKPIKLLTDIIRQIHKLFFFLIDYKNAGIYRKQSVFISGTSYIPPKASLIPGLMSEFEDRFNKLQETVHPVRLASFAHQKIAGIHPFIDGNGRTARLVMNLILINNGYQIVSLDPKIRSQYIEAIKASQNSADGGRDPFSDFLANEELKAQRRYARLLGINLKIKRPETALKKVTI